MNTKEERKAYLKFSNEISGKKTPQPLTLGEDDTIYFRTSIDSRDLNAWTLDKDGMLEPLSSYPAVEEILVSAGELEEPDILICQALFINESEIPPFSRISQEADEISDEAFRATAALETSDGFIPFEADSAFRALKRTCGSIFLDWISVDPRYQNNGLATTLLENIQMILFEKYEITTRYVFTILDKTTWSGSGIKQQYPITTKHILSNAGFIQPGGPGGSFWMKRCSPVQYVRRQDGSDLLDAFDSGQ